METDPVPRGLRISAAYAWRILVICACGLVLLVILDKLALVVISLFIGMIIAAISSPLVRMIHKVLPRFLAVILGLLILVAVVVGILVFITGSIAGEWETLTQQFGDGVRQIETWLQDGPLHLSASDFSLWFENGKSWVTDHRADLVQGALGGAGTALTVIAVFALAMFSAVFFLQSGRTIWLWMLILVPKGDRIRIDGAGYVAWRSFAGYTRGIFIVAACNAVMVCFLLLVLRVPLAVPLALLVFFGTFIPLIGAPVAMLVAVVVALAAQGPITALVVLTGIFILGQIEGHVLNPLVMSKAVNIHPLAVAVSVASGTLIAGLLGAVVAVPVVSVIYGVAKFWFQTAPPKVPPGPDDDGLVPLDPDPPRRESLPAR